MGVPVITVPGETFASRHSASYLSSIGLTELIAENQTQYAELAVNLARDTSRLSDLRSNLRERMSESPICNYEQFALDFAAIVREIWRNWCYKTKL